MIKPIIEIKNLSAGYDGHTVLHDVNLSIYERDFLGIIGPNGGGKTEQREKGKQIIARMGLEGLESRSIGQLSGGQLQRALLGRAIISDPAVLILDEPSTYIDKRFEARLYELLAEINKECAIILVSHDIGTVLQQVKSIACVNETLDYHPDTGVTTEWLERNFNCPIELLGHGTLPHRVLGEHHHHH